MIIPIKSGKDCFHRVRIKSRAEVSTSAIFFE